MVDFLDTMEMARAELAKAMVPTPEDLLDGMGPLGVLFYAEQTVVEAFKLLVFFASESADDPDAEEGDLPRVIEAVGMALGQLDAACILLGILPPEAAGG